MGTGENKEKGEHLKNLAKNSFWYCLKFYPNNPNIWYKIGVLESDENAQQAYECFGKTI
jgi:lipoprotein NlpI